MTESQEPDIIASKPGGGIQKDSDSRYFPWLLLFEALVFLYLARIMFLVLPFKHCVRLLSPPGNPANPPHPEFLFHLRHAIRRANKFALWSNKCLIMSATARWMLNRRKISSQMLFGVKPDSNPSRSLFAHAWITSHNTEIVKKNGSYMVMLRL